MLVQKWRDSPRRRRRQGDRRRHGDQSSDRLQPYAPQQEGPHHGVRRPSVRDGEIDEEWRTYVEAKRVAELDKIIAEEGLKPRRRRRSSSAPSATAAFQWPARLSRGSCRLPHASRQRVVTERRSSGCSLASPRSSRDSLGLVRPGDGNDWNNRSRRSSLGPCSPSGESLRVQGKEPALVQV